VSTLLGGEELVDQRPIMGKVLRFGSKIMRLDLSMLSRPQSSVLSA
jgi:hypothetical protein